MTTDHVKEQLIKATIMLLKEGNEASKITARNISAKAGANLAMINYYFTSKDALMSVAVDQIIAGRAIELAEIKDKNIPAKQKLTEFLLKMADITVEYSQYTKATIPYVLLEKELEAPYHIVPLVKECFDYKRDETECKLIAFQLTMFSQIAFFRSDDFKKYLGLDVMNESDRKALLTMMITILIQN